MKNVLKFDDESIEKMTDQMGTEEPEQEEEPQDQPEES
jgi:hypothetical protein